ncbi:MAG TPA: bifunctional 5,10-methylenetetrahydrofolate dehydrogenase/5,10-methenyltetrahydrofolate cyclohydrolase [Atribacterota bacterium]|nr:bifunctional 5,10-methylenetetrahydrofolate dehydrogenase/5,10-methenyltetrahydrofolate cyclohydrolase [Atribacterota bacterium]
MRANFIDGKAIAATIKDELILDTEKFFQNTNIQPKLSVIILGKDPASLFYVRMIEKTCQKVNFQFEKHALSSEISEDELLELIEQQNNDIQVHGIIIQTPLPKHINQEKIQRALNPGKDVDCFNPVNMGNLAMGNPEFLPCTPNAVVEILKRENIDVEGKHVVIVGRSNIVGKPLALILLLKQPHANATVTVCHSRTTNISSFTRKADIVVAAAGRAGLIKKDMVANNTVVIDVGTNEVEGKLVGDVDFDEVSNVASKITPVPGGVGPVTNMMLMRNTLQAAKNITEEVY